MQQVFLLFFTLSMYVTTSLSVRNLCKVNGALVITNQTPILEYQCAEHGISATSLHRSKLISRRIDIPLDKDRSFYNYPLTEDGDDNLNQSNSLPIEVLFDDLSDLASSFLH